MRGFGWPLVPNGETRSHATDRIPPKGLRPYLNNRPIWRQPGNFLYFFVRYGNTPFRPVDLSVSVAYRRETILDAVDHDVSARRNTEFFCAIFVSLVWIGNMQGEVKPAVPVSSIDDIGPLRRLVVALPFLRPDRVSPQGDFVGFKHFTL